jgi:hypothetical protein
MTITEGRQTLTLDASWHAVKWDDAGEFEGSMEPTFNQLSGRSVKAADVVGVRQGRGMATVLLVAELKDFDRSHLPAARAAAVARQGTSDEVMRDIIAKVIDSLCGATFANDAEGARAPELDRWRTALGLKTTSVLVLVCVELPPTQAVSVGPWNTALKKRLRWLGPRAHVIVTDARRPFPVDGLAYGVS